MKYSLKSSFARLVLMLFVSVLFLTIVGRIVAVTGAWAYCVGWPVCTPTNSLGYIKLGHVILVGIASVFMALVWRKAWREQREQKILLPLTTVTGVLFLGQAFIGAIEVTRSYPLHLVVLHTMTAISLWISLSVLVFASGVLAQNAVEIPKLNYVQRIKDFFILSKPLIVALLLVTTYSGLVAGTQLGLLRRFFGLCLRCRGSRFKRFEINSLTVSWIKTCSALPNVRLQTAG